MADFSAIRKEECRESKLPNGGELNGSHTVVLQSVINEIKEHGRSSMHAEVCGVLVGSLCWDGGPYLLIDGRIEGKHASHQSGSVTFTSETWDFIHEELATKYPDRKIVGWYHTHPGFGIFLSNMDAFIHENFFSFPWEPAYVFDPQAETDGFFFKVGTELVQEEVYIFGDVEPSVKDPMIGFAFPEKIVIGDRPRRSYLIPSIVIAAVVFCCVVVGTHLTKKVRDTEQTAMAAEAKAEALRGTLANKDAEIKRHQREAREWGIREETYEKEIAGLKFKVTTITTERRDLAASNRAKQVVVDRLKSERADLKKAVHEREAQISDRRLEVEKVKSELVTAREQMQRLEQRIKELEASSMNTEKPENAERESPRSETLSVAPTPAETKDAKKRPWYSWIMFWK